MQIKSKNKPDRRTYTFMIVPHRGEKIYRWELPIKTLKVCAVALVTAVITTASIVGYQGYMAKQAQYVQNELTELRMNKSAQEEKIVALSQTAGQLQQKIQEIDALEAEVKRALNSPDSNKTSRSGVERSNAASQYNGQGGPTTMNVDSLMAQVQSLDDQVKQKRASLSNLREQLAERNKRLKATPTDWPTQGSVTSRFGWRRSPFGGGSDFHPGIDIANAVGTPVYATADGIVTSAGWYSGYGQYVEIEHGYGYATAYGHNSVIAVGVGQAVKRGDVVAYMGNTGYSTGSHLHYEVKVNGQAVDPAPFL